MRKKYKEENNYNKIMGSNDSKGVESINVYISGPRAPESTRPPVGLDAVE